METALDLVALVAVIGVVSALAVRVGVSAPLLLAVVGVVGSYLPFVPNVALNADLVLVGLLPPLLYAAAVRTSLVDFRTNRRAIGLLSVGLVVFTALGVGLVAWLLLPIPLGVAVALGAVVAPPDAVATTAVARRIGMPRRIVTILEGESLVNDATALVCLRTALATLAGPISAPIVALDFVVAAGGAVLVGIVVAYLLGEIRRRVRTVVLDTTLSLAAPFVAYLPAEAMHASGVLAVVVTGLLLGHRAPVLQSAASRISERTNWTTVQFLLENAVFLLIGLQVRTIVLAAGRSPLGTTRIWVACAAILAAVLLLRPVWVFPATYLPRRIRSVRDADPSPPWQMPAVVSWAGMRGVVTLAAVFIIPAQVPHREVLVLAALVVVAGTLGLQGLTLPSVVHALGLHGPDPREDALQHAVVLQEATEAGLEALAAQPADTVPDVVADSLRRRVGERTHAAWERLGAPESDLETPSHAYTRLRLVMLQAERRRLLELRDGGQVPDEVLRSVMAALDVEESMLDRIEEQDERVARVLAPEALTGSCAHLLEAGRCHVPQTPGECPDCVREGLMWVHLRMCLECGVVGCCDSSPGQHASRHYETTSHPVMRSVEPGEAWRWCFVDKVVG
ncbi:MAG: Na+/H+ antiporter [Actinomycetes bacterium]